MKPRRTDKQKELMGLILQAANAGELLNIKELHEKISYDASYGAVRISVRFLVKLGMIERSPEGNSNKLAPTLKGYDWFRPAV